MDKNKFALSMPEGTGLMAYLEKGEKGLLRSQVAASKAVYELFVFSPCHVCGGCLWAQGIIQCP